jgi:hypothetical protein
LLQSAGAQIAKASTARGGMTRRRALLGCAASHDAVMEALLILRCLIKRAGNAQRPTHFVFFLSAECCERFFFIFGSGGGDLPFSGIIDFSVTKGSRDYIWRVCKSSKYTQIFPKLFGTLTFLFS